MKLSLIQNGIEFPVHEVKSVGKKIKRSFELKLDDVDDSGRFSGYGSIFGVEDFGGDIVAKGAFTRTLREIEESKKQVPILWQHDHREPVGYYPVLREDDKGLYVEGQLDLDIQAGKDAHSRLKKRYVSGLSIGYSSRKADYDETNDVRTLLDLDLYEVSLVTFPMNDEARINAVKERIERGLLPKTEREFERFLRDVGFSQKNAKEIAANGIKNLILQRDVGSDEEAEQVLHALKNFKLSTIGLNYETQSTAG